MKQSLHALSLFLVPVIASASPHNYIGVDTDSAKAPLNCTIEASGAISDKHSFDEVTCLGQKMIWLEYKRRVNRELRYSLTPGESLLDQMLCGYRDGRRYERHLWAIGKWIDRTSGGGEARSLRLAWLAEIDYGGFKISRVPTKLIVCSIDDS
jgi:hypothetical protein